MSSALKYYQYVDPASGGSRGNKNVKESIPPRKLFEGPKHFWRTRQQLHLVIIEYPDNDCLEVNGWWDAATKSTGNKRQHQAFYLRSSKLRPLLDEEDIKAKVALAEKFSKWSLAPAQREERYQGVTDVAMANHIFNRINIVDESTSSSSSDGDDVNDENSQVKNSIAAGTMTLESIVFSRAIGDGIAEEIMEKPMHLVSVVESLMTEKQEHLVVKSPTNLRRRRSLRSIKIDWDSAVSTFRRNFEEAHMNRTEANRLSELAAFVMERILLASKASSERRQLSMARQRWLWAYRMVLLRNRVKKTRDHLVELGIPIPEPILTSFSNRRSSMATALSSNIVHVLSTGSVQEGQQQVGVENNHDGGSGTMEQQTKISHAMKLPPIKGVPGNAVPDISTDKKRNSIFGVRKGLSDITNSGGRSSTQESAIVSIPRRPAVPDRNGITRITFNCPLSTDAAESILASAGAVLKGFNKRSHSSVESGNSAPSFGAPPKKPKSRSNSFSDRGGSHSDGVGGESSTRGRKPSLPNFSSASAKCNVVRVVAPATIEEDIAAERQ